MGRLFDTWDFKRVRASREWQAKMAGHVIPGLPIDGDPPEMRKPSRTAGSVMDSLLEEILKEENPFYDAVVEKWSELFPDLPMKPGRMDGTKLFLYVRTSGKLFACRPKLQQIKKVLASLEGAPGRFSLHLEIHK